MADTKITALTAISTVDPAIDVLPIVDVSDTTMAASGTTKKITSNQILGAGGTATLASATITGDLTVDTSTLKVDSANNRVGIGTASPTVALDVVGASAISGTVSVGTTTPLATGSGRGNVTVNGSTDAILAFGIAGVNSGFVLQDSAGMTLLSSGATYLRCYTNGSERYKIDSTGVATWSNVGGVAGTTMTLNSTGLGVGASPGERLTIQTALTGTTVGSNTVGRFQSNGSGYDAHIALGDNVNPSARIGYLSSAMYFWTNGAERVRIDSSGNVVVGTAAVATTATDGFLYVTGCAGTPTGTPTAKTGRVPIVVDTTNNKLYFYSGGSWVAAN